MAGLKPRQDRIFVVLRLDQYDVPLDDPTLCVVATKAFLDESEARAEVERLNELNRGKSAIYFWRVVRMRPGAARALETKAYQ